MLSYLKYTPRNLIRVLVRLACPSIISQTSLCRSLNPICITRTKRTPCFNRLLELPGPTIRIRTTPFTLRYYTNYSLFIIFLLCFFPCHQRADVVPKQQSPRSSLAAALRSGMASDDFRDSNYAIYTDPRFDGN